MISVFCNDPVTDTGDLSYGGSFDVVVGSGGVADSVLRCNIETSFNVGTIPGWRPIGETEFYTLWGAIVFLFVTAVCVRYVIRVLQ